MGAQGPANGEDLIVCAEAAPAPAGMIRRLHGERGAQLAEYALILSLVTILSIPILGQIGSTVFSFFASYLSGLDGSGTP